MKREDKAVVINELAQKLKDASHFYLTDISSLNAEDTSNLRRKCFEKDIELLVVKNTLLRKAMEQSERDYSEMFEVLKGATSIMFTDAANVPGKLIKELRRKSDKPVVKAAYVEETVYIGDNMLDTLATIKSKNELIADVISLLQSPAKNVVSALQSGGQTITGVLKTLSEK
ncbi:MAG: 50S ribosomal protein L10 [Bacteroidetes bacterium HGW-Bacteroidetes-4]|jgi:large subunit ribosomal protein L10|nr:MAG: 50S ribosomal protein L10 [Bacteroidetes bacterium HGW-Bacteroidetes-4]